MRKSSKWLLASLAFCVASATMAFAAKDSITSAPWGEVKGKPVKIFTLRNSHGMVARITDYGGIVVSLTVPGRNGKMADVLLGFDNVKDYVKESPYFGALIGRYGNRIGNAQFKLDGKVYKLVANEGKNQLHGGKVGFDKVIWNATPKVTSDGPSLILTHLSKNGDQGFPGDLHVKAIYTLTNSNELSINFTATTDKPTIVNLTNHCYFNLAGAGSGTILNEMMQINAKKIVLVNKQMIATGKLENVKGTPYDFTKFTRIGARIFDNNQQLKFGLGYDECFVINKPLGKFGWMARAYDPKSGRELEVLSNQPGVQFYSGNQIKKPIVGKGGKVYKRFAAFTLEPEDYPDAPNHPNFPSCVLRPGQVYHHLMIYKFLVHK